ncbi:uncharacterized protein FOMMEDRAFT_157103 [Fomitiporia mediterranea MF3/22]|uniref:uncharacterized protein n=1 Tax=Fomitiporia mediterranea (strain MF3/22) TaxID=694068 RepID=UPI0004408F73|nr:uncharacterized protein FOMMEDRAFT_157103 [Fomitiporia mediterranea MF3/22]EJD01961.1 hypothetical protein FOMMEDRAFT_157103 [Fomitiporia mediterranea MF3/22]
MRSIFMTSSRSLPEMHSLLDDDVSSKERSYTSEYTCSLFSERLSSNQTCDDLPGPGRIIDKYIYQPGGRFLERKLNPLLYGRDRLRELYQAETSIDNFFKSVALQSSGYFLVKHGYWDIDGFKVIKLSLSGLLYFWGGQNIKSWDNSIVRDQCRVIAASIRSQRRNVKLEAIRIAAILLNKYPRLWRYFNVSSIRRELLAEKVTLSGGPYSEFDKTSGFYSLLHNLSLELPQDRLSRTDSLSTRVSLLSFIADVLEDYSSEIESHVELQCFIRQLLYIHGVHILFDLKSNSEFSEVVFWEKYIRLLDKKPESWSQDDIDVKLTLFTCLHMCLKGNVETMPPSLYINEEITTKMAMSPGRSSGRRSSRSERNRVEICEEFARLHFDVFLKRSSLSNSGKENRDETWTSFEEESTTLKSRVKQRLSLSDRQIEYIWYRSVEAFPRA